jgi:signal transduction histidine kinase
VKTKSYPTPRDLLIITILAMFAIEVFIMLILEVASPFDRWLPEAIFDGIVESSILFPVMYLLLYRPMSRHIKERRRAEAALRESHEQLERKVQGRTADLRAANEQLRLLSAHIITAQEEERKRVAMELHDRVGQDLASLKLQLRSLCETGGDSPGGLKEACNETLKVTKQIMDNVQNLSRDLTPMVLSDLGLTEALRWLAADSSRKFGYEVTGEISRIDHLFPQDTQLNIYRIFQEILTNAGKHASAGKVQISTEPAGADFRFRLADDGDGFDTAAVAAQHPSERRLGLLFLEERARMAGGSIEISSRPGEGTRVTLTLPHGRREDG